ncbi:hypothetical protein, conserved [Eimeria necatrix]|uniref:Uncharacterized protein n=1 Tax=Eimeria necatrix TaxID=51315 RepID=U6MQF8_9EIME|nr:hypothetical protein, conserved [Eimeria necatrix]CDJ65313.1 hypothetical protein, conserved [Eimeria necatrix]
MRTSRHKLHLILQLAKHQKRKLQSKSSNGGEKGSNSKCAAPGTSHLPIVALSGNGGDCFLERSYSVSSSNKHSNPCSKQDSIRPLRHTLVAPREQQQQHLLQLSTKRKKLLHRKWLKERHFVLGRCGHHRLLQARRLASLQLLRCSNEQQQRSSNSRKHGSSSYTNETCRENNGNEKIKRRRHSSSNFANSCSQCNFSNGVSSNSGSATTNSSTASVEKANSSPVLEPAPKCAFTNIEFEEGASQALQRLPDQEKYQELVQQHQVNQRSVQQQQEWHMQEQQCRQQQEREEICEVKPFIEGVLGGFSRSSTSGSRQHQQEQEQQDQQQKKQVEQLLNPLIDPLEASGSSAGDSSSTGEFHNYQQDQQLLLQQTPVCLQPRHTGKSSVRRSQQQQQQQGFELAADPEEIRRRQQRLQRDWGKEPIFCRIPSQSKHAPTLRELKDRLERLVQQQRQQNELQRQVQCHQGEKQQQQNAQEGSEVNDNDPQLCSAQVLQQQAGCCCFGGNEHGSSQLLAGQLLLRQRRQQQEAWRILWRDFAQEEFRALRQHCIAQRRSVLKAALTVPAATAGAAESAAGGDCPTEASPIALEAEGAADAIAPTAAAAASTPAGGVDSAAALTSRAAPAEGDAAATGAEAVVDSSKCQQLDVDGFLLQLLLQNLAAAAAAADAAESAVCCAALERLLLRKCVARAASGASAAAASTGFHALLQQGLAFRLLLTTAAGAAALSTANSSMGSSLTLVTRIENEQQQQPQPHQCQQQQQSVASWARRLAASLRLRNFNRAFKLLQLLQQQASREHCSVTSCKGNTRHTCCSSSEGLETPMGSCSMQGQQQAEEQHMQQQKHCGPQQPQQHGAQQQQHESILIDLFLALLPLLRSAFVELLLQAGPQKHREAAAAAAAAVAAAGNISTAAQGISPHMVNPLHSELLLKQHQQQLLLLQQERSKADAVLKSLPLSVRRQLLLL